MILKKDDISRVTWEKYYIFSECLMQQIPRNSYSKKRYYQRDGPQDLVDPHLKINAIPLDSDQWVRGSTAATTSAKEKVKANICDKSWISKQSSSFIACDLIWWILTLKNSDFRRLVITRDVRTDRMTHGRSGGQNGDARSQRTANFNHETTFTTLFLISFVFNLFPLFS